ncbi:CLEC3A [Mytilus edulis]|uniref:CLEC3A n=1 Tax=Mytilus edulis TaxID=6550 RepID=A0A8S3SF55_MYTED|nr:CLEC3A [Mytilus edulis]
MRLVNTAYGAYLNIRSTIQILHINIKVLKDRGIVCMMAQHYKIYFVLLIVIFLSSNTCYAQGLFEDGVSALLPLLLLGLLAATTPTATAAQAAPAQAAQAAPAAVPVMAVSVPVAPTPPCVSETCPPGFMLLPNQGISTSCYSDSDTGAAVADANDRSWNAALTDCTMTPGAYLWRPNTEQEADAVRNKYTLPDDEFVWTGANLNADGTFRFAIENGLLDFTDLPFGAAASGAPDIAPDTDCVGLGFDGGEGEWKDHVCNTARRYICEYPRVSIIIQLCGNNLFT